MKKKNRDLSGFIAANYQQAMDQNYIKAYYQPVIRTVSRQLCSFEALARWDDPERGMIYPDEFISALEEADAIHLLDAFMVRQVCSRIRESLDRAETPVPVSVNLSRRDFTLCDILAVVDGIVSEYHLPHDLIYFEITEGAMAEEKDLMLDNIRRFRSAGYQIWMDDFGSAYSSLNLLKEYSFDELKMDMGFLRPFSQRSQRIAASVIDMAKGIDIHTLAEGVDSQEQFRFLRNIGCEKVQGYLFGSPMPYDDAINYLEEMDIAIERPSDRKYYDDIGSVNVLSAVPFMTREEKEAVVTARELNSIPLALIEVRRETYSILFYNTAFEELADDTGLFSMKFIQEDLRKQRPYHLISGKVLNLMDSTRAGGKGRMNFTSKEDYYELEAKCVAQTQDKYTVLLRMNNLTKTTKAENTGRLDEYLRSICAIYERITLLDLREDRIVPLYTSTKENLLSERRGIRGLVREYAKEYIFPDDREEYIRLADPDLGREYFASTGRDHIVKLLRTSVRHGQYEWKAYVLLRVGEDEHLLLISEAHDEMLSFEEARHPSPAIRGDARAPEALWRNLIRADLIRVFWKDRQRRFLGASKAFLDYYGFESADEIIGKTDEDLGWHIRPDKYMNDEYRVLREGITTHNIPGLCMCDGENKEILASKTPLYDDNGEIAGLMGYFIDRKLLMANDRRGDETLRRDMLTGLLNSRGIAEEAAHFRDEYFLRGIDFVRIHIEVDDFNSLNDQYGFDFGDKVLEALGRALTKVFGLTCSVGRFSGHSFVVLHQVRDSGELRELPDRIKAISSSIQEIEGTPVTLYLSAGFALFSEDPDLDEQAEAAERRFRKVREHVQADRASGLPDRGVTETEKIRIALIGYGNVGQAFARMLKRRQEYIQQTFHTETMITAVCTRRRGGVIRPEGLDTEKLTEDMFDQSLKAMDIIRSGAYDVMVELTPINIMTGQPATDHIRAALLLGKHVITANKGPIAWAYRPLRDLARQKGVQFRYEATVMDGTPVYNLTRETLMGCRITGVSGIFNATTNFILTEMERGVSFEEAVEEGRRQGFVEADASMDIDGWDAAAKLTALMNVLMDVQITPDQIDRTGIGEITKEDIEAAKKQGKRIKLLCTGKMVEGRPRGTVAPTLVDIDTLPAIMDATSSYITIDTDLMGETTVIEEPFEPEIDHTAYGVLSDLLQIIRGRNFCDDGREK